MRFRMVDGVLSWEREKRIRGVKAVSFEEYSLKEAFGEGGKLPESLLLQAFFGLGSWLVVLSSDFREAGLPLGFERVRFLSPVGPGEHVICEMEAEEYGPEEVSLRAAGSCCGREVAVAAGLRVRRVTLSALADPDDVRVLSGELCARPAEGP